MKIVVATDNPGKAREFIAGLSEHEVLTLQDFPDIPAIVETENTLQGNALLKARIVSKATGLYTIADDSGLFVDALNGDPGVYTARYSNDWESLPGETRDARNNRKILHAMKDVPDEKRGCAYKICLAIVDPATGYEKTLFAEWHGFLLQAPVGTNGFAYDPLFFDYKIGKTAAEMTTAEKAKYSHRGQVIRQLQEVLACVEDNPLMKC